MKYNEKIKFKKIKNKVEAISIIQYLLSEIKKNTLIKIEKAVLFGSFANQQQHEYSDIDLALWSEDFTGVGFLDTQQLSSLFYQNPEFVSIECHFFNREDDNPFQNEIRATGIEILLP